MYYGLCFMVGWMWNHVWEGHEAIKSWRCYEGNHEEIWIQRWVQMCRFYPCDLNSNEEIQKSMVEPSMKCFKIRMFSKDKNGNTYGEQHIALNTKMKTCFQSSKDEDLNLAWSKYVSSQGGLL